MPRQLNIVIGAINNFWQNSHFSNEKTKILSFFLILKDQKTLGKYYSNALLYKKLAQSHPKIPFSQTICPLHESIGRRCEELHFQYVGSRWTQGSDKPDLESIPERVGSKLTDANINWNVFKPLFTKELKQKAFDSPSEVVSNVVETRELLGCTVSLETVNKSVSIMRK